MKYCLTKLTLLLICLGVTILSGCKSDNTQSAITTKPDNIKDQTNKPLQPNFVWLVSEDNSKHYLKLYNEKGASMPNIEALATNGLVFDHAFSNAPVCSTARSTLALGAYAPKVGTLFHRAFQKSSITDSLEPISLLLKNNGYFTSNNIKTDFNFEEKQPIWNSISYKASWRERKPNQPFFHMQSWYSTHEGSLHFPLSDIANKPTIHDPADVDLPPIYPDTEAFRYTYARYLDLNTKVDNEIGKVINQLKEDGLLENTFIFYFGDHGGALPNSKGYLNETGLHVPLVVRIPENFKHLLSKDMAQAIPTRVNGFVSFIDFAPTLLKLAGLNKSPIHDGSAFLGQDISLEQLNQRDQTFGFASRFDEKSDLVRSYRKGNLKYLRHYQPYNPDSLFSDYRYKLQALKQWKELFEQNKLNSAQAAFFKTKPVEALYDINNDPYETKNLAKLPQYQNQLLSMRTALQSQLKSMPDLGFYPESFLIKNALSAPIEFGIKHKQNIAKLIDIADLQLQPFNQVKAELTTALHSNNAVERYWALISLTSFGFEAIKLADEVKAIMLSDTNLLVQARAIEFLAMIDEINPVEPLQQLVQKSTDNMEILNMLNIATMLHDQKGYKFTIPHREEWKDFDKSHPRYKDQNNLVYWLTNRVKYLII
ncbi:sulfatase-like hydrolase/transferase [Colwellia sp. RE-S-Sl-9]